jgi:Family of unknown function (DUF6502)
VSSSDIAQGLLRGAMEALRPIVKRLLASGVPFGMLEAQLRELVVEVAEHEFVLEGRRQTDSRVSLVTGINRKEVRRIRGRSEPSPRPPSFGRNQAAGMMSRWRADPRATDRAGRPKAIPYKAARGPSFVKLAEQVTVDLPARAILDELVRTGAVETRDDGWVVPKSDAYVPKLGRAEKLAMLAEDPADLVETMLRNIFEEIGEPLLQRRVSYDNIGAEAVIELRRQIRTAAEAFLRRIDRLLAKSDRDRNPKAPGGERRVAGLGIYYFEAPQERRSRRAAARGRPRRGSDEESKE